MMTRKTGIPILTGLLLGLGLALALLSSALAQPGAEPALTPTPSPTCTPPCGATRTPTPTPTPAGDLTMTGLVYDASVGESAPIAGATVRLVSCLPRTFSTTSGPDGRYSLFVPGSYLGCTSVQIGASAAGYRALAYRVRVRDLLAHPERDFGLNPVATPTATSSPTPTGPLPDLVVSSMKWNMQGYHGGCVPAYSSLVLQVTVTNQGDGDAGGFTVRATQGTAQQDWPVSGLAANSSLTLESTPGVFSAGSDPVTGTADVFGEVAESDEGNNVLTQQLPVPTPPPLCTPTPTPGVSPSPTATPTSMPGPPTLIAPLNGTVLPQPVAPNEWDFLWSAREGPCYSSITITGPGGRILGSSYVPYPYEYNYSQPDYLPDDALSPWYWSVAVYCPLGSNTSDVWTFSVERAPTPTPTPP